MDKAIPSRPETIVLYTADPHESAMPVVRILGPAQLAGLRVILGNRGPQVDTHKVAEADVVIIQRDFPRFALACAAIFEAAQAQGKPVVYETDDLLLVLPTGHFSRKDISDALLPILWAIVEADLITTSTPRLLEYLEPFNPKIRVLPNYLNDQVWSLPDKRGDWPSGESVCIGYMGGQSHLGDLASIQPALESILTTYQDHIRLKFWGVRPPEELLQHAEVEWIPLELQDYGAFARYFSQQTCDVFIAPLEDNLFNRAKSAIKYLEYSALGVPGVYSSIPAYGAVIVDGQNGFLASSQQDWETNLASLINHPDLRKQVGAAAQKTIRENWLLSQHADQWPQAYQQATQNARTSQPQRSERIQAVAQAASQIQTRHHELDAENQQLHRDLEAQSTLAKHLQSQLDEIYQSRSWQMLQKLHRLRHRMVPPDSLRETILKKLGLLSRSS